MFFTVVVVHSFKRYLFERISRFGCNCAVRKDVDVVLFSVLLCMQNWL
jgi:hypothetical protein